MSADISGDAPGMSAAKPLLIQPPVLERPQGFRRLNQFGSNRSSNGKAAPDTGTPATSVDLEDLCLSQQSKSLTSLSGDIELCSAYSASLAEVLESTWHVVDPWSEASFKVPSGMQLVIILADLKDLDPAKAALQGLLWSENPEPLPIFVLVLRDSSAKPPDVEQFALACRHFQQQQVVSTFLQPHSILELELEVDRGLERVAVQSEAEQRAMQEFQALQDQAMRAHDAAALDQKDRLNMTFFAVVHRFLREYPRMQYSLEAIPAEGIEVNGYLVEKQISNGAFSTLYLARSTTDNQQVVIKSFNKDHMNSIEDVHKGWNESRLLVSLQHESIIEFYANVHMRHQVILILEYAGSLNLTRLLEQEGGRLNLLQAKPIASQLIEAIAYCHRKSVAHQDLNLENLFVVDGLLKVVGFGHAARANKPCKQGAGSIPFMAPEAMAFGEYDAALADMWSIGIILLEMLCGPGTVAGLVNSKHHSQSKPGSNKVQLAALAADVCACFAGDRAVRGSLANALNQPPSEDLLLLIQHLVNVHPHLRWRAADASTAQWLQT